MVKLFEALVLIGAFGSALIQTAQANIPHHQFGSRFQQSSRVGSFQQELPFLPQIPESQSRHGPGLEPSRPNIRPEFPRPPPGIIDPVFPPTRPDNTRPPYGSEWVYGNGIPGHLAKINHEHFRIDPEGNYNFAYRQSDLQEREETGTVAIDPKTNKNTLDNVIGSYRYVRPDGLWQIVEYVADRNGFIPKVRTEGYAGNAAILREQH